MSDPHPFDTSGRPTNTNADVDAIFTSRSWASWEEFAIELENPIGSNIRPYPYRTVEEALIEADEAGILDFTFCIYDVGEDVFYLYVNY